MNDRYPVNLTGELDPGLSRWLWLVKWILAIPHFVLLVFLWIGFVLATIGAFFALLFTGRYPHAIFRYCTGVLRWSWRVDFYCYGTLATDRYPPFTLADVPDYPARVEIAYPEHHRRGLPLIGWWLLGIPQYAIAGILSGGTAMGVAGLQWTVAAGGLIGVLVLVALILLLVRGEYPRGIFDLVMGLNRWAMRACAFGAFLTPEYPPFRIDIEDREHPEPPGLTAAPGV